MALMYDRPSRHRWIMPLIVLAVGGSLAFWASRREAARMRAVEQQVLAICRLVGEEQPDHTGNPDASRTDQRAPATPGALTGLINSSNPTVEEVVLERLREIVDSPLVADAIAVRVTPGDLAGAGMSMSPATHTAMLVLGGVDRLALRVQCESPDEPIVILGFVAPDRR